MKTSPRPITDREGQPGSFLLLMTLCSNPRLLSTVRGAVEPLAEMLGFPGAQRRSIMRAVDEALSNIVRHSYGNRPDRPITLYFRRARRRRGNSVEQGLEIILCDQGPAVDPDKLRGRALDELRPGGLGLHFIHEAMDTVEFRRKGLTNRLRLVKYVAPASKDV
jgi:anti-sigma regulatory factor (Ser/Thr protein kinase)